MKKVLLFAISCIFPFYIYSQIFEKVTNSPLNLPIEAIGSTWGDYDNDGDLDIFINVWTRSINDPQGYGRLFQNNCDGNFTKVTAIPGNILSDVGTWASNASWIDYNNDGFIDLYTSHEGRNNSLYHNNGDGTFKQITDLPFVNDHAYTRGHTWVDLNNDGWLDLYLANDGNTLRQNDFLYLSTAPNTWQQITEGAIVNDNKRSNGCTFGDYNNDGYMDFYDSNNRLFKNNGNGTFLQILNTIEPLCNWSNSWVDFDNDLDLDLFLHGCTSLKNRLSINNGDGTFTSLIGDPLVNTIVANNGGQTWGDYDNDGDLDVFVSDFYKNQLYNNNGNGTFTRVTTEVIGNENVAESYGATWCDYDKDGDLDLFVPNAFGNPPNYFYINTYQNRGNNNNWININCKGVYSNTSAIGARIYAKAKINGVDKWQMREINANHSTPQGGVNPLNQHFGFGNAAFIDTLKVFWPTSGITHIYTDVPTNKFIDIIEGDNTIYESKKCNSDFPPLNPAIIKGVVFNDTDMNCEYNEETDFYLRNRIIQATVGNYYVITNENGEYELRVPQGEFNISQLPKTEENFINSHCANTDSVYNVSVTENEVSVGNDFEGFLEGLECGIDIKEISTGKIKNPCPGETVSHTFLITNNGPAIPNLIINYIPNYPFVSNFIDNCSYNKLSGNGDTCSIKFYITVPAKTEEEDYYGEIFKIDLYSNYKCQGNDTVQLDTITYPMDCAEDPNDKILLNPIGCGEYNKIAKDEELIYRLRFQNTGTAPAYNILVSDKLNENLDISTFKILYTSHSLSRFEIIPDNNLIFKFDNIMLPDTGANYEKSQGYIIFSIKPKKDVIDGSVITNQAGIYFDRNAVVLTNVTTNMLVTDPLPRATIQAQHDCTYQGFVYNFSLQGDFIGTETYYWNFGEGSIPQFSTERNPTNIVFSSIGKKEISVTITKDGCVNSLQHTLNVKEIACGNDKIKVCHNGNTICINKNALQAHIAHGDCIGECNNGNLKSENINFERDISINYNDIDNSIEINSEIETENGIFEVYDNSGKLVFNNTIGSIKKGITLINVNYLSKGVYYISIKTNNIQKTIAIVKI